MQRSDAKQRTRGVVARLGAALRVGLVAAGVAVGCGEDTPQGEDLAAPAERDAVPAPAAEPVAPPQPPPADAGVPRTGAPAALGDAPDRAIAPTVPQPPPPNAPQAAPERDDERGAPP